MSLRVLLPVARLVLPLALALLLYVAPAAAEEQRLFAVVNGGVNQRSVSQLWEATIVDGRVVSAVPRVAVPGRVANEQGDISNVSLASTAGGRFIVWRQYEAFGSAEGIVVLDRVTGQAAVVRAALTDGLGVSDPTRPRLFAVYEGEIASVSAEGIAILPNTAGLIPRAISRDGKRLYAIHPEPLPSTVRLVVLDSATGEILHTLPLANVFSYVWELVVSDDESTVWLWTYPRVRGELPTNDGRLRPFDVASGAQTLAIPLPSGSDRGINVSYRGLVLDEVGQRVAISWTTNLPPYHTKAA
jgi:hypothetical protein